MFGDLTIKLHLVCICSEIGLGFEVYYASLLQCSIEQTQFMCDKMLQLEIGKQGPCVLLLPTAIDIRKLIF
jgi:hypothetical protein